MTSSLSLGETLQGFAGKDPLQELLDLERRMATHGNLGLSAVPSTTGPETPCAFSGGDLAGHILAGAHVGCCALPCICSLLTVYKVALPVSLAGGRLPCMLCVCSVQGPVSPHPHLPSVSCPSHPAGHTRLQVLILSLLEPSTHTFSSQGCVAHGILSGLHISFSSESDLCQE